MNIITYQSKLLKIKFKHILFHNGVNQVKVKDVFKFYIIHIILLYK